MTQLHAFLSDKRQIKTLTDSSSLPSFLSRKRKIYLSVLRLFFAISITSPIFDIT